MIKKTIEEFENELENDAEIEIENNTESELIALTENQELVTGISRINEQLDIIILILMIYVIWRLVASMYIKMGWKK